LDALADELGAADANIIPCDPREKEDSKTLVLALLQEVIAAESSEEVGEVGEEASDDFELM